MLSVSAFPQTYHNQSMLVKRGVFTFRKPTTAPLGSSAPLRAWSMPSMSGFSLPKFSMPKFSIPSFRRSSSSPPLRVPGDTSTAPSVPGTSLLRTAGDGAALPGPALAFKPSSSIDRLTATRDKDQTKLMTMLKKTPPSEMRPSELSQAKLLLFRKKTADQRIERLSNLHANLNKLLPQAE